MRNRDYNDNTKRRKCRSRHIPQPAHVPPRLAHQQSCIIFHGRGSNAEKFAPPLLYMKTSRGQETLPEAFPHAKFIFPTTPLNRARAFNRSIIHQWFDIWYLKAQPHLRNEVMVDGLKKTVTYIHELLRAEIDAVGQKNVTVWGLSQGRAAMLIALLTWTGPPVAAAVGMCRWLPFTNAITEVFEHEEGEDFFEREDASSGKDDGEPDMTDDFQKKEEVIRETIEFIAYVLEVEPPSLLGYQNVPIFLGHGIEDEVTVIDRGTEAVKCLKLLQANARLSEYKDLGHWYSEEMLEDIFKFLGENL